MALSARDSRTFRSAGGILGSWQRSHSALWRRRIGAPRLANPDRRKIPHTKSTKVAKVHRLVFLDGIYAHPDKTRYLVLASAEACRSRESCLVLLPAFLLS